MLTAMASELNLLAHALNRLSEKDPVSRDFTLNSCRRVLREVAASFPVYRTYLRARDTSKSDRQVIAAAVADASRRNPLMETSIFDFARAMLLPEPAPDQGGDAHTDERWQFARKVQQFTAPVQAKGVEDTAFYRYNLLISANDVGGNPGRPAVAPERGCPRTDQCHFGGPRSLAQSRRRVDANQRAEPHEGRRRVGARPE